MFLCVQDGRKGGGGGIQIKELFFLHGNERVGSEIVLFTLPLPEVSEIVYLQFFSVIASTNVMTALA